MRRCLIAILCLTLACRAVSQIQPVPSGSHPFSDWSDWTSLNLPVSYFSVERIGNRPQLWFGAMAGGVDSVVRLTGDDLKSMKRVPPQFNTRLVTDYDRELDGVAHPILSRVSALTLQDGTEVVMGSVGPRYRGGASELLPVLFTRAADGKWIYLGVPKGEPAAFVAAARAEKATVRCEGGGMVQLPDGRLRMYCHGMVPADQVTSSIRGGRLRAATLLIAEADSPEGPWRFKRDDEGRVIDLMKNQSLPWLFPHVQSLGQEGFLLTGADAWPPTAVYAAYSQDGITFGTPADSESRPVPLKRANRVREDATFCKALRGALNPETGRFTAVMNVSRPSDNGRSVLYAGGARFDLKTFTHLTDRAEN